VPQLVTNAPPTRSCVLVIFSIKIRGFFSLLLSSPLSVSFALKSFFNSLPPPPFEFSLYQVLFFSFFFFFFFL